MERTRSREFYNTQINRYVRNHATNIQVKPQPGDAYRQMRIIARAVIYQALKDACEAEEENRERLKRLLHRDDLKLKHKYFYENKDFGDYEVQIFQSLYGREITWTSIAPEAVRFFFSEDYRFYAGLAGIDETGDHLLRQFRERKRTDRSATIDTLIDG